MADRAGFDPSFRTSPEELGAAFTSLLGQWLESETQRNRGRAQGLSELLREEGQMTNKDLQFLKRATPEDLLKLTNDTPWEWCCFISVDLTSSKALTVEQMREAFETEKGKWVAAGAVPADPAENMRWVTKGSCDECGNIKASFPDPGYRFTFSREQGFGWHNLCGSCKQDFDYHVYPLKLAELAVRWQGRCLARQKVTQ
jgi:hypothetical protein